MKKSGIILSVLLLLIIGCPELKASFDPWGQDLETRLRNLTIKNNYSKRLLFPKPDRQPTTATTLKNNKILLINIYDDRKLYAGRIDPENISSIEILNRPIFPGAFHFATVFHFKEPGIKIVSKIGETKTIKGLVMGTGPEMDFDPRAISGFQLINMLTCSLEHYKNNDVKMSKYLNKVDPEKVDLKLFFLAHAEEATRLDAMYQLRALRGIRPELGDKIIFQKYNVFGQNCIASGIQNLARAIKPKYHKKFLAMAKKDIKSIPVLSEKHFRYFIYAWHRLRNISRKAIIDQNLELENLNELENYHVNLRKNNRLSLPWRAKSLIDWATID
jgi:hypothetical protein